MSFARRLWFRVWKSSTQRRLEACLPAWRSESAYLAHDRPEEAWAREAARLYERAEVALARGAPEEAWQCALAADRIALDGLDPAARKVVAYAILAETKAKLIGWRTEGIVNALTTDGVLRQDISASELRVVAASLADRNSNVHRRAEAVRNQLRSLSIICFAVCMTWLVCGSVQLQAHPDVGVFNQWLIAGCAPFGILGACLSAIISLARLPLSGNLPERLLSLKFMFARTLTGAVAAIVIHIFVSGGLLPLVENVEIEQVLAISFVAGFSERLLTKAVETVK